MKPPIHPEVGRELRAHDLKVRTIVWTGRGDRLASLWVNTIEPEFVELIAAAHTPPIHILLRRDSAGYLFDDSGERIFIFEYLGEYPAEVS